MPNPIADVVLGPNEGYQDYVRARRAYVRALTEKWAWLLEGTKKQNLTPIPTHQWEAMAILFENQQAISNGIATEATLKTDVTLPQRYALPIIRKVYPQLIAMKIASVQPMPLSSGGVMNVYYQDFKREDVSPETSLTVLDSDYAQSSENAVPKRVKMEITSQSVTADKKILGASWSTEIQEDARGALNIDVESELVDQMAMEILREIDQIVLAEILLWAGSGNVNWHWTMGDTYTSAKDWYETFGHACIDAEDLIYGNRYRKADWIVCGRNVTKYVRKMQDFMPTARTQPPISAQLGVEQVGTVTGFWDVYQTMMIDTNRAIMGVYPRSTTDTGYVFAPYIPLAPMPLVYAEYASPTDVTMPGAYTNVDKWSRNVRTRYGKKLVVPNLFATLSISA